MKELDVLHKLRNAYGLSNDELREVRLASADLIEQYKEAYLNMRQFAEANGLDTATRNQIGPTGHDRKSEPLAGAMPVTDDLP